MIVKKLNKKYLKWIIYMYNIIKCKLDMNILILKRCIWIKYYVCDYLIIENVFMYKNLILKFNKKNYGIFFLFVYINLNVIK